jgi:hypothetical protein
MELRPVSNGTYTYCTRQSEYDVAGASRMFGVPDADPEPRFDAHDRVNVNVEVQMHLAFDLHTGGGRTHLNHQIQGTCPDTANAAAISPPAQNPAGASAPSIANMSERVRPGG